ncbi:MAG: hypothetical protein Q4F97_12425 [Bacteroidales bacterium]|nr:hypothetical protein [Bacteroidales bacterium]
MKNFNQLLELILVFFISVNVISCSKDNEPEITSFVMEKTYFEVPINQSKQIFINNGSLDLDFSIIDNEMANITYSLIKDDQNKPIGCLQIDAKKKGTFQLLITDKISNENNTLTIKIVDTYLSINFSTSNHPLLTTSSSLFLINDEQHTFYLFTEDNMTHTLKKSCIGNYSFSLEKYDEDYVPYLTLSYISDNNGMPTNENLPTTDYKFSLLGSSTSLYSIINYYLGVDWNSLKELANTSSIKHTQSNIDSSSSTITNPLQTRDNSPESSANIIMMEMNRGYSASGEIVKESIPENILK